jgi:hypothetical protein
MRYKSRLGVRTIVVWLGWLAACGTAPSGAPELSVQGARGPGLPGPSDDAAFEAESDTPGTVADSGGEVSSAERDGIPEGLIGVERFDASGTRKVFARRLPGAVFSEIVVAESSGATWIEEVRISGTASPDRPAISADGETIAFVTGVSGVASVWTMPFVGGENPTQRTNVGVEAGKRSPGAPPAGFVPPPLASDGLVFSGDWLGWEGPSGPVTVRWR